MITPVRTASPPPVHFGQFDGPLDLLIDEVRRQNVAIEKIAMAPIVARYLEYMRAAAQRNLNLDIEWLHMAATLIHWKSRALLPQSPDDAVAGRDTLRDDLAHKKQAADELARRRSLEETQFSRGSGSEVREPPPLPEINGSAFVSVWDLMRQARDLGAWVEHRHKHRRWIFDVNPDEPGVEDMIRYLRSCLTSHGGRVEALGLLEEQPSTHRPSLFLALLELAREEGLQVGQKTSFGPVWLWDLQRAGNDTGINDTGI